MPSETSHPETTESKSGFLARLLGRLVRAVAFARQRPLLTVVVTIGSAIILTSCLSVIPLLITKYTMPKTPVSVSTALAQLDEGEYGNARDLALQLQRLAADNQKKQAGPLFIQGVILAHEASEAVGTDERERLNLVAARYLEEARDRGFPKGREAQGTYCLATCLYRSGNYAESLAPLQEAVKLAPRHRFELYGLLAQAYLKDEHPQLEKALHFNQLALENPSLTADQRDAAALRQARILLNMDQLSESQKWIDTIAADSSVHDQTLVLRGELLIREGDQLQAELGGTKDTPAAPAQAKYSEAIAVLERAQSKDDLTGPTTRQSRYLLGICHLKNGDARAAEEAFVRTRRIHYQTPEGLAAAVYEAELLSARGQYDLALDALLSMLSDVADPSVYHNSWLPLSELRNRLSIAQKQFRGAEQFDLAIRLGEAARRIALEDTIVANAAETYEAWGDSLTRHADSRASEAGPGTLAEARRHFRTAADAYLALSKLRFATEQYPDYLWKSGECHERGHNFELAIPILNKYLTVSHPRSHPRALVAIGRSHLALGAPEESVRVLEECIKSHPKHPETYDARLVAATAYQELGNRTRAMELLVDNLDNEALTTRSIQWQESLFAYGTLLYREAMLHETNSRLDRVDSDDNAERRTGLRELEKAYELFQAAIDRLDEAVKRHPDAPAADEARYLIAESYRQSAKLPRKKLPIEPAQTRRIALREDMKKLLQTSAELHHQLRTRLNQKQEQEHLTDVEQAILRNSYFAHADALFDLGEYEKAIQAYAAASNRYQDEPASLEAFMQIASCYRQLGAPSEARGTLLQAQAVLGRIRPDADFKETTRYNRDQWEQLLGWLSKM